jgi:Electron transfer DM13
MKNLICISVLFFGMFSCQKETVEDMVVTPTPIPPTVISPTPIVVSNDQTLLLSGTFTTGAHVTSGTVKVYEDKDKNRTLVFENFKTDAGPDLRLYMAEDKAITNFVQITDKVTTSGNYSLMIPATVDLKKQTTVAIWCKSFSVLFGSATLK